MSLANKVAIVTGASTGIGRAYALALAGAGATVVAAARSLRVPGEDIPGTLQEVVHCGTGLPGRVRAQACDMERESDVALLVEDTVAQFGRLDILVNNAAMRVGQGFLDVPCEDWGRLMRTNVLGPYLAIRNAVPQMRRQRAGSIINITARAGQFVPKGEPASNPNVLSYALSKAALNRLTFFMAEELREDGIAVNALSPGSVATGPNILAASPKPATPEVLGPPLLFLAEQTAAGLTGQILHADEYRRSWP
jgi:NAD(P)-dependent dehydrogenase (short-subunit alcohol dehydrogenase family)